MPVTNIQTQKLKELGVMIVMITKKPKPAFCAECKYSTQKVTPINNFYSLHCTNRKVINKHIFKTPTLLAASNVADFSYPAEEERVNKSWCAPCGMNGKLWEPKDE